MSHPSAELKTDKLFPTDITNTHASRQAAWRQTPELPILSLNVPTGIEYS